MFPVNPIAIFHIVCGGIGAHITETGIANTFLIQCLQHRIHQTQLFQNPVGDNQYIVTVFLPKKLRKLFDAAGPGNIFRHPIGNGIVSQLKRGLIQAAPQNFQFIQQRHRFYILPSLQNTLFLTVNISVYFCRHPGKSCIFSIAEAPLKVYPASEKGSFRTILMKTQHIIPFYHPYKKESSAPQRTPMLCHAYRKQYRRNAISASSLGII